MKQFEQFQERIARKILVLIWTFLPILAVMSWHSGRNTTMVLAFGLLAAAIPTLLYVGKRPIFIVAIALALSLVGALSLAVCMTGSAFAPHSIHFCCLVVIALMSSFCDSRILLSTAAIVLVQHFAIGEFWSAAIEPDGNGVPLGFVDIAVVLGETGILLVAGRVVRFAIAGSLRAKSFAVRPIPTV